VKWIYDWDWPGAEKEFQRAIQPNPGPQHQSRMYANFLDSIGRFEEAIRELRVARELDPVALILILAQRMRRNAFADASPTRLRYMRSRRSYRKSTPPLADHAYEWKNVERWLTPAPVLS
jgi:hypothetical protein